MAGRQGVLQMDMEVGILKGHDASNSMDTVFW